MTWTPQDLVAYARRRQKSSELKAVISPHRKATAHGAGKGSLDASKPKQKPKSGYSVPVVLAWFKECGLPTPEVEYRFDEKRRWRFDFAFLPHDNLSRLALEVQGGLFSGGAHVRGAALLKEYEKYNRACELGWRLLFVTPQQLCTQETTAMIERSLALDA